MVSLCLLCPYVLQFAPACRELLIREGIRVDVHVVAELGSHEAVSDERLPILDRRGLYNFSRRASPITIISEMTPDAARKR